LRLELHQLSESIGKLQSGTKLFISWAWNIVNMKVLPTERPLVIYLYLTMHGIYIACFDIRALPSERPLVFYLYLTVHGIYITCFDILALLSERPLVLYLYLTMHGIDIACFDIRI